VSSYFESLPEGERVLVACKCGMLCYDAKNGSMRFKCVVCRAWEAPVTDQAVLTAFHLSGLRAAWELIQSRWETRRSQRIGNSDAVEEP